jgi:hypothetical protein
MVDLIFKGEIPSELFARLMADTSNIEVSNVNYEVELPYGTLTIQDLHIDGKIVCTDSGSWIDEPEYDYVISSFSVGSMYLHDSEDGDLYSMTSEMVDLIFKQLTPIITD